MADPEVCCWHTEHFLPIATLITFPSQLPPCILWERASELSGHGAACPASFGTGDVERERASVFVGPADSEVCISCYLRTERFVGTLLISRRMCLVSLLGPQIDVHVRDIVDAPSSSLCPLHASPTSLSSALLSARSTVTATSAKNERLPTYPRPLPPHKGQCERHLDISVPLMDVYPRRNHGI